MARSKYVYEALHCKLGFIVLAKGDAFMQVMGDGEKAEKREGLELGRLKVWDRVKNVYLVALEHGGPGESFI